MRIQNYPLMITISPKAEEAFSNLLSFTTRHSRIQTLSHSLSISLSVTAAFLFHTFSHSLSPNTTKTLFYHYIYAYISVCLFICFTKPKISCTWKFICSFSSVSNTLCVALFNALRFYNKSLKQSINIYLVSLTFLGAVLNFSVGRQEKKTYLYERSHFTLDNKEQLRSDVCLKGNFWSDKLRIVTTQLQVIDSIEKSFAIARNCLQQF